MADLFDSIQGSKFFSELDLHSLRFQAGGDAEIKTVPKHFARANQADRCITLLHCAQRLTPSLLDTRGCERKVECFSLFESYVT